MARQEKSTRARGLPPRVLLSQRQDATGSFPTVWRTSSDNRTGRYNVSFNDNKVVPFNQYEAADYDVDFVARAAADVADGVQYVEKVIHMSPGLVDTLQVDFSPILFTGNPIVVISELSSSDSSQNINVFFKDVTNSKIILGFSSPFSGSFVYRAAYDPALGTLRIVERKPRYINAFTRFVAQNATLTATNTADITFNDFGDDTAENFITFFDSFANNQADIWPNITTQTRTLVALTASSIATATVEYERFHGLHNRGIIYPLGMNQATILAGLSQENQIEMYGSVSFISGAVVNQPTKWIVASGSMKKNIADTFITFTPGQDIQAFRDNNNQAVDGKISSSVNGINPFYATGSAVTVTGQGFQQPLWSKSKIEIDITPSAEQTIGVDGTSSTTNFPMCYWNFKNNQYDGVGSGKGFEGYSEDDAGVNQTLSDQAIGFGTSFIFFDQDTNPVSASNALKMTGYPISNFGFPYHPKFQPKQAQQLFMVDYISEPFLLEKIVFEVSAALQLPGLDSTTPIDPGITASIMWSCFLLNSKRQLPEKKITQDMTKLVYPEFLPVTYTTSSNLDGNGSYLDLIDFAQVGFKDDIVFQSPNRELLVEPSINTSNTTYQGQMSISSSVKVMYGYKKGNVFQIILGASLIQETEMMSGRNQINEVNGRDWHSSFSMPSVKSGGAAFLGSSFSFDVDVNNEYTKKTPYILLPTDKLTFGWHMPLFEQMTGSALLDNNIAFSTQGINKITFYGSSLRVNPETNQLEEHHDTLNQLLSSESIHEVIG